MSAPTSQTVETFIDQWVEAAQDLAMFFAGQPDSTAEARLEEMRADLRADFTARFPDALDWDALLDRFVQAVLEQKRLIENEASARRDGPH